ncbi:ROK family transcriptional regulator [Eubacteriales bacterium OttesenSCG-928-A19]|nr:ROK family transcriptional regulator [Eubacteriales bacterium OttesenSCG-928-A19]
MSAVSKNNADGMSLRNQIMILQYLQRNGVSTRTQIARYMNLTQAAVSKIVASMMERGIIEETGFLSGEKGRRSVGVRIRQDGCKVIGVKLSRRSYAVGVFDFSGRRLDHIAETFEEGDPLQGVFKAIRRAVRKYLESYQDIRAIGIAVPGPFLKDEDIILMITQMGDASEEDIDLRVEFDADRMLGTPVVISQDANAGAMAEWWYGIENMPLHGTVVHYLVGEGVGAGIIVDGKVLTGELGIAGEIGHISIDVHGPRCHCGNYGCLELYCSSISFVKHAMKHRHEDQASTLNRYESLTVEDIFRESEAGDTLAASFVRRVATYIGYGVVMMVNAYNPTTIFICNELSRGGQPLLDQVIAVCRERLLPRIFESVQIVLSTYRDDDLLIGAAAVAIDYCLARPDMMSMPAEG